MTKKKIDIPKDWNFTKLSNLGQFLKGKGIAKSEVIEDGIPCVRYGEIYTNHNDYIKEFTSFTTQESANQSTRLEYGDILFAGSGETLEDIGKSVAFVDEFEAFAGGDIIILRGHNQDPKFLGFLLNTDFVSRQTFQLGQGHSVVHIYSSGLKNVKIPLPPLPEQQKIAKILSTWDKAIDKLTQLIAAKAQRKRSLMQQLLTGKKRFAGFREEWKEVKLETLVKFKNGKGHENYVEDNGEYVLVNSKFVASEGKVYKMVNEAHELLKKGTIVMVMSDVPNDKALARCYLINEDNKFTLNQRICSLTPKGVNTDFLLYQLNRNNFYMKFDSGVGQTNLKKQEVLNCPILLPDKGEQQKIAFVLSAADKEIKLLKKELKSLQQQKKGLMQVLLTGEIRVKI